VAARFELLEGVVTNATHPPGLSKGTLARTVEWTGHFAIVPARPCL